MQMTDMVKVRAAFVASVCVLVLIAEVVAMPDARAMMAIGAAVEPPKRPDQFRNIAELNHYLAELRQYYTILGRPRFGRSVDRVMSEPDVVADIKH